MDVTVTYNGDNRITIKGKGIYAVLTIEQSELLKVYSREKGQAKLLLDLENEPEK